MNRISLNSLFVLLLVTTITACKKPYDYDKEVAAPVASTEKINARLNGNWVMQKATEVDEKSLVKEGIEITDFLLSAGKAPNITFNTSDNTFTVDTAGLLINYFVVDHGKWKYDDARYPTKITLSDAGNTALTEISIGSNLLGLSPQLNYISGIDCGTTKAISYNLTFTKHN